MKNKRVSTLYTYMILIISMGLIAVCIIGKIPLFYGFFLAVIFSMIVLMINGFCLSNLADMILKAWKECVEIFVIVLLTGAIISMWIASGTVPTMIYYGFKYISHTNYLLACFFITVIVSIVMGTAFGTVSTIGVALIGIGKGLLIPTPILLGTIISGAFVGDKMSPIGVLVNLTIKTIDIQYKEFSKYILKTLIPIIGVSSIIYYILGKSYGNNIDTYKLRLYQESIRDAFFISPLLLLFPIIIMILAISGIKIIPNLTLGLFGGILVSIFFQKMSYIEILKALFLGYHATTGTKELNEILRGGGIASVFEVILIIMGAIALSSIFEGTNIIAPIIHQFTYKIKSKVKLMIRTGILSIALTTATCDQTAGILLPGRLLKEKYKELEIKKAVLARIIADTGTTIAPLIPWNINAILITAITGITAVEYGPYAVLCYISPAVTIFIGAIGCANLKIKEIASEKI
ncbi:Na+/H+ antiporter NhaC family protein [Clostridiaceae bacterium 35-E11]